MEKGRGEIVVAVIDGLGGGLGAEIVSRLRSALPRQVEIIALGTNAIATERMLKARANRGASGENAIRVTVQSADFIVGPIGIVIPNSMLGEITPEIAQTVVAAPGVKLLLPVEQSHLQIMGIEPKSLGEHIESAIDEIVRQARLSPPVSQA